MTRGLGIHYIGLGETPEGARQLFRNHVMRETILEQKEGLLRLAVSANQESSPCLIVTFVDGRVCSLVGDNLENNDVGFNCGVVANGTYASFTERKLGQPVESKVLANGRLLTYRCAGIDGRICRVRIRYDSDDRARQCSLEAWAHDPERCKCRPGGVEL